MTFFVNAKKKKGKKEHERFLFEARQTVVVTFESFSIDSIVISQFWTPSALETTTICQTQIETDFTQALKLAKSCSIDCRSLFFHQFEYRKPMEKRTDIVCSVV